MKFKTRTKIVNKYVHQRQIRFKKQNAGKMGGRAIKYPTRKKQ